MLPVRKRVHGILCVLNIVSESVIVKPNHCIISLTFGKNSRLKIHSYLYFRRYLRFLKEGRFTTVSLI